jgi:hypothetical protein
MNLNTNFWMYSYSSNQAEKASQLIAFGAETFKSSYIISNLNELKRIQKDLDNGNNITLGNMPPFYFNYLIDCIKICIFFENYMKAELIIRGFCVHKIKNTIPNFKDISKRQYKEPILLSEIHSIEAFTINEKENEIFHNALSNATLGFKELIGNKQYLVNYAFNDSLLKLIYEINTTRNTLHFYDSIRFSISEPFLKNIEEMNDFVDSTTKKYGFYHNIK